MEVYRDLRGSGTGNTGCRNFDQSASVASIQRLVFSRLAPKGTDARLPVGGNAIRQRAEFAGEGDSGPGKTCSSFARRSCSRALTKTSAGEIVRAKSGVLEAGLP